MFNECRYASIAIKSVIKMDYNQQTDVSNLLSLLGNYIMYEDKMYNDMMCKQSNV